MERRTPHRPSQGRRRCWLLMNEFRDTGGGLWEHKKFGTSIFPNYACPFLWYSASAMMNNTLPNYACHFLWYSASLMRNNTQACSPSMWPRPSSPIILDRDYSYHYMRVPQIPSLPRNLTRPFAPISPDMDCSSHIRAAWSCPSSPSHMRAA